uniref:AB hydrolase-1 domain-containing protein n=1 Tax=Chromera velia CCMP2878 TaxID=1169474 RepID=A0A0G4FHZ4_9ALVE|eukprot:Cvel_3329.t1-p1 / transcript=Cvel_3329.t1 / gene=Cvel_3329 / organism=Chromera_velia_CCMP2878 / gene_product=hypothetical protein / transcript_product=hypothetical protein / location=Cvel_scaffold132:81795-84051(+) / protein_length=651 / sequence_SO=supercontig / SO=protein_coding / is_pseudo=false
MSSVFVETPFGRLHLLDNQANVQESKQGDLPTVLLLHGARKTLTAKGWEPSLPALAAAGIRALALDFPGHGESGGDLAEGAASPVKVVASVVDKLGLKSLFLGGRADGGRTVLLCATSTEPPLKSALHGVILCHPVAADVKVLQAVKQQARLRKLLWWAKDDEGQGQPFKGPHGAHYFVQQIGCGLNLWEMAAWKANTNEFFGSEEFVEAVKFEALAAIRRRGVPLGGGGVAAGGGQEKGVGEREEGAEKEKDNNEGAVALSVSPLVPSLAEISIESLPDMSEETQKEAAEAEQKEGKGKGEGGGKGEDSGIPKAPAPAGSQKEAEKDETRESNSKTEGSTEGTAKSVPKEAEKDEKKKDKEKAQQAQPLISAVAPSNPPSVSWRDNPEAFNRQKDSELEAGGGSFFVKTPYGDVHIFHASPEGKGDKDTLPLYAAMHGDGAKSSAADWLSALQPLADRSSYRVCAVSMPGYGLSSGKRSAFRQSGVEVLMSVLEGLKVRFSFSSVVVGGRSVGGRTSLELGSQWKAIAASSKLSFKIKALVLTHPVVPSEQVARAAGAAFPILLTWATDDGFHYNRAILAAQKGKAGGGDALAKATAGHPYFGPRGAAFLVSLTGCELLSWQEKDFSDVSEFYADVFPIRVARFLTKKVK